MISIYIVFFYLLYLWLLTNKQNGARYSKQPHETEKSLIERYLGLLVSSDLKWANQVEKATQNSKRNNFSYFDAELVTN